MYGHSDEDDESETKDKLVPFFLVHFAGVLTSLIDALHGIKARTIREECSSSKETDDDDADAIVAHALARNDCDLFTAKRNNILRHYDISGSPSYSYSGSDGRGLAKFRKVLGRSGHHLPIS